MWNHEVAARLGIAFEQMVKVYAESLDDEIDRDRLREAMAIVKRLRDAETAGKPNHGVRTGYMPDAADGAKHKPGDRMKIAYETVRQMLDKATPEERAWILKIVGQ